MTDEQLAIPEMLADHKSASDTGAIPREGVPKQRKPSYTSLVHELLRAAKYPLSVQEIVAGVSGRRPIAGRDPEGTIRNVMYNSRGLLINVGNGCYGYLPHLLQGSLLRLPLTQKKPANHPLVYSDEVRLALWPSFFESLNRRSTAPVSARLPNSEEVILSLDEVQLAWGCAMPGSLRSYLVQNRSKEGDALLIRVLGAEAGRHELCFESHLKRNEPAIGTRNREVADAAYEILRRRPAAPCYAYELTPLLLGRQLYKHDLAPDALATILGTDRRFVDARLSSWVLAEAMTPELAALVQRRKWLATAYGERMWKVGQTTRGLRCSIFAAHPSGPSPTPARRSTTRMMAPRRRPKAYPLARKPDSRRVGKQ